jgi:enoyl-[acyl-carrier protein] reductase/trans-2-enoyl-CoA reductase (NAD+)
VGLVDVEVASDLDIERTNKLHGHVVAAVGRAARGRGPHREGREHRRPSATTTTRRTIRSTRWARSRARRSSSARRWLQIHERFGAITARLCYPPVGTTALGAIPGGLLMYGLSAQILLEQGPSTGT